MAHYEMRADGYKNLLNKYGTNEDVSEHYRFEADTPVSDMELTINYENNGLFTKIIDIPADDAISSGFSLDVDKDIENFIKNSLDEMDYEEKFSSAIRWSRLYGGAVIVMLVDDGGDLENPINWDNVRGIDELLVFERPLVFPDYKSVYNYKPNDKSGRSKFGMPEYYNISQPWGNPFRVHESRCLIFKNGTLPAISSKAEYRFFGIPEYLHIHKALQGAVVAPGNGVKLLDRAVQAIYKMRDLSELLSSELGEDKVMERLRLIDMARGIINSIVIDAEGEDYDYKSVSFSGIKEIIDCTCNMLSAVCNIPQTKLFGRSPAGENSTGESDMENYYKYVEKIQKINVKNNLSTLIDIILIAGKCKGEYNSIPDYKIEFTPLWSLSEKEMADVDKIRADTEYVKAQTAQVYVDMQALDASEIRNKLSENGDFTINDILDDVSLEDWTGESEATSNTALSKKLSEEQAEEQAIDGESIDPIGDSYRVIPTGCGCGVIVIQDGKILVGNRKDNGLVCGPGGHIEVGETPEMAAIREAREEFGINVASLTPLDVISNLPIQYEPSHIFITKEFFGTPKCFNDEMEDARFVSIGDLEKYDLFIPFKLSIESLLTKLQDYSNISIDGGPGSGRHPEGSGEKSDKGTQKKPSEESAGKKQKTTLKEPMKIGSIVSASGSNFLTVKAFKSRQHLNNHWQKHGADYEDEGMTKADYERRAVELAESPVGNGIIGYRSQDGYICRYDTSRNDYVKADINKGVRTMFKPEGKMEYYKERLEAEKGVENDET